MNKLKKIIFRLKQPKKYAAFNPSNFEEIWSFNATGIQLLSLITLIILVIGTLFTFIIVQGPFVSYFSKNDVSIERKKLEEQDREFSKLNNRINEQEKYIADLKTILSGQVIVDSLDENVPDVQLIGGTDLDDQPTENEKELSGKVKDDLRTTKKKKNTSVQFFINPVSGVVSQKFDLVKHPAIDIVTTKDANVLACLSGTVIFSGYTTSDGFVIIIDHANGYLSLYKHNKALLKKMGAKVQMGDPIAIVGNSGENTTGPHLHFELWFNQSVINPEDYMKFSK